MKKRIVYYLAYMDAILQEEDSQLDYEELMANHLKQIEFFMHERLIHLIVTVTFAILTVMTLFALMLSKSAQLLPLILLLLVLLVPYVFHYYRLENGVQKMYDQYDKLREYLSKE